MKRIMVAMALMGAALVAATGVAWAATVDCKVGVFCEGTDEPEELIGTNSVDHVFGKAWTASSTARGRTLGRWLRSSILPKTKVARES